MNGGVLFDGPFNALNGDGTIRQGELENTLLFIWGHIHHPSMAATFATHGGDAAVCCSRDIQTIKGWILKTDTTEGHINGAAYRSGQA